MLTKEEKLKLLNDTIEYYCNNPRSIDYVTKYCKYFGKNGERCAFSRIITKPEAIEELKKHEGLGCGNSSIEKVYHLEGLAWEDKIFYQKIQQLHDFEAHWVDISDNKRELTRNGINHVSYIKDYIEDIINLG